MRGFSKKNQERLAMPRRRMDWAMRLTRTVCIQGFVKMAMGSR